MTFGHRCGGRPRRERARLHTGVGANWLWLTTHQLKAEAMILAHDLVSYTRRQMFEIFIRIRPISPFRDIVPEALRISILIRLLWGYGY